MTDREKHIQFHLNYCQHYGREGSKMICKAGMSLDEIQRIPTTDGRIKWGPCIGGHTLEDPKTHCPNWTRRTQESAEAYADSIEKSMTRFTKTIPWVSAMKKKHKAISHGTDTCPICGETIHFSISSYNRHMRAQCETKDCVNFIE